MKNNIEIVLNTEIHLLHNINLIFLKNLTNNYIEIE